MDDFVTALAAAEGQPARSFQALHQLAQRRIGARLFTVTLCDPVRPVVWRAYSSHPQDYPVTGEKPLGDDRWSDQVIGRGQPFVANSVAEFADVFSDHALIQSLGCESCLNLPVFIAGRFRGSLNCLDVAGHYTPDRVQAAQALIVPAVAVILLSDASRA